MTVASPCISKCLMDETSRLCQGCSRTIDEIIAWGSMNDAAKSQVLLIITQRKKFLESYMTSEHSKYNASQQDGHDLL